MRVGGQRAKARSTVGLVDIFPDNHYRVIYHVTAPAG
jgi:hypothetical protein